MERQYEYFAVVTDARPSLEKPLLVCRRWVDDGGQVHDEAFTAQLAWEPSTALNRAEAGDGEVHRVDAEAATRFEQVQRDRVRRMEPEDGRYSYIAWVDVGATLDDPTVVIRTWMSPKGHDLEERYRGDGKWEDSDIRYDWHRGRKDGELESIDEATAQRIIQMWEQWRTEQG